MVLSRNMKKRFPAEQYNAIEENRLLILSPFDERITQSSRESCLKRDEIVAKIADKIVIGFANKKWRSRDANNRSN